MMYSTSVKNIIKMALSMFNDEDGVVALTVVLHGFFYSRASKPPPGLHLDVLKDGKMIQVSKLQIFFLFLFYDLCVLHYSFLSLVSISLFIFSSHNANI